MFWKLFAHIWRDRARRPGTRRRVTPRVETLEDRLTPTAPLAPVIIEPLTNGQVVSHFDVHMEIDPVAYFDADGHTHLATSWQIRETAANGGAAVWQALNVTDLLSKQHIHMGDGSFVGSLAGQTSLLPSHDYQLQTIFTDSNNEVSTAALRAFRTTDQATPVPGLGDWIYHEGYQLELAASADAFRLPVNIAFIPNAGTNPNDPFYYVTELYGSIKVVTRSGQVSDYATGLLDYNPDGPISGSGEQGLTGIAVDPVTGDLFVGMLWDNGTTPAQRGSEDLHFPKVERLHSIDGGRTMATRSIILNMQPETQGQSHQISNITFGPDGKLYVHMGDAFDFATPLNLNSYRGKVLRLNKDGSAPTDNPFYSAADGINAKDYVYTYGHRNPFGGAWRDANNTHYIVENGNGVDRLVNLTPGQSYGWAGDDSAFYANSLYIWDPANAPVNLAFVQPGTFGGSLFPAADQGSAFVALSGPTYAGGPQTLGKRIEEFTDLDSVDANGKLTTPPITLLNYNGTGHASISALAAGPDGLYFADLYPDSGAVGPTGIGANVYRLRYVDFHPTGVTATVGTGQVTLDWLPDPLAVSHNVYRSVEGEHEVLVGAGITGTSFTDSTISPTEHYHYVIRGVNAGGESSDSNEVHVEPTTPPTLDFSAGFAGSGTQLAYNGSAVINGTRAELTNGGILQAGSIFTTTRVNVDQFSTQFTFQLTGADADGFTFTMQDNSPTALGPVGGGLGYGPDNTSGARGIGNSVAVKFDLYPNQTETGNSTGLYVNGAAPTHIGSIDLTPTGLDLHSGHIFKVSMNYDGAVLAVTITDMDADISATQTYTVNIAAAVGSTTAYVGFTGATGGQTAIQDIRTWTYSTGVIQPPTAPAAPTGLSAPAVSASAVTLAWTNNANNQTGFHLDRATNNTFTQNLVTLNLPQAPNTYTDTAVTVGATYYYRLRAFNAVGESASSNVVSVLIPTTQSPALDFSGGFAGSTATLTYNGSAAISTGKARLTSDPTIYQAGSVFSTAAVDVSTFTTQFTFQLTAGGATADGFTFAIQGVAPTTLGPAGGELAFGGIARSVAVKFDLYDNNGEGDSSTGLYTNGATPMNVGSINLFPSLDLHSGHIFQVNMTYNGTTLTVVIKDTVTNATATQNYTINIPTIVQATTAYVGFTAGTGGLTATQEILTWTYTPGTVQPPQTPAAPSALAGQPASATSIALTWTSTAVNHTGFHLDRATNSTFTQDLVTLNLPATPNAFTDTGLTADGTYYYRLRAFNGAGDSANSNAITVVLLSTPTAPSALAGQPASATSIALTWTSTAVNHTGFHLDRATNSTFTQNLVTLNLPTTPNAFSDTGLTADGTYYYRLRAYNGAGDSANSNAITVVLLSTPTAPSALAGQPASATSIALTWTSTAVNHTGFHLDRATNNTFTQNLVTLNLPTTPNAYTDTGLTAGGTYYYRLRAYNGSGDSANSNAITVVIPSTPAAPSALAGQPASATSIALTWTSTAVNHTGFHLDRATNSTFTQNLVTLNLPATPNAYTNTGLATGTYYYRLRTYNGSGDSANSNAITVVIPSTPTAPSALAGQAASATSIALTWTSTAVNHTGFHLDRATNSTFTQNLVTLNLPATPNAYTNTGLAAGTYYYRLRTYNVSGDSANSNAITVVIPLTPAAPTNLLVTSVTTTQVALSWTDNASSNATGYRISRAVNQGAFTTYATLPAATAVWTDTSVSAGTFYSYQVVAFNIAGNSAAAATSVTTLTVAPTGLTATAGNAIVSLAWTAPTGAVSYKIYRGTSAGGQGATPIATGVTTTTYNDTTAVNGTTYFYKVVAVNANATRTPPLAADSTASNEASATPAVQTPALNFTNFTGSTSKLTYNGSAVINAGKARLTNNSTYKAGSVFSTAVVDITKFTTQFTFQIGSGANTADGFTFTIQGAGATALGMAGGGLGYGKDNTGTAGNPGIANSVAIKFDLYDNQGEGTSSTGLYTNGAAPTNVGSINLNPTINLHSGRIFQVNMTYNGTTLTVVIKDTVSNTTLTQNYTVNIPSIVGASTARVGFTGGTGGLTAVQNILTWSYTQTGAVPPPPTNVIASASNGTAILSWTAPPVTGVTYSIYRGTTSGGESLTPIASGISATTFTDTTTVPGTRYYYFVKTIRNVGGQIFESIGSLEVNVLV